MKISFRNINATKKWQRKLRLELIFKTKLGALSGNHSAPSLARIEVVAVMVPAGVRPARAEFPELPIYTPKEVNELKGLEPDEVLLLHEAKIFFGGQNLPQWKKVIVLI